MKLLRSTLLLLAVAIAFAACKKSTDKSSETTQGEMISQEEIEKGFEEVIFPLPEPMSVYQMLENIGASYAKEALNPVASAEKYFTSNIKSVNVGVYGADLSYTLVYNKKDDIDLYSKTLKKLVDDLDIKVNYRSLVSEESKEMAMSNDSLIKLSSEIFFDIYEFLYKESDPAMAVLMANGFYVEGLYIATHISEETFNNIEMVKIIYGQSKPLEEIIKLNEKFGDNEYISAIQGSLIKLKELYDSTDGSLTEEQLKQITTIIESIRESMVS
ncbi:MAG: hypothetical protein JXA77_08940 [Bacteroidales bacterium]|nr:hypothetical protein [Bacteroidales bacterium]MBN2819566.1 hypothetical protein [Bacteroidales bacterium]